MPSEESVRRELAVYMKSELGMNVKLPNKESKQSSNRCKESAISAKQQILPKQSKLGKTKSAFPLSSSSSSSSTSKIKNHKSRQRDRKKQQKIENHKSITSTTTTTGILSTSTKTDIFIPSTNKNTLKNKRRREAKKRLNQRLTESNVSPSSVKINETISNDIVNHTLNKNSSLNAAQSSLAVQQLIEENAAKFKSLSKSFDSEQKWWNHQEANYSIISTSIPTLTKSQQTIILNKSTEEKINSHRRKAESLLSAFVASVNSSSSSLSSQDSRWVSNILQTGTLTDKIAALQLLIQDRCVGRLELLDKLLNLAKKKGRRESNLAIDALKDLFTQQLIPTDRTLTFFTHQPYFHLDTKITDKNASFSSPSDTTLIYWLFEDHLKQAYTTFLTVCEEHLHDSMPYIKKHSINILYSLLVAVPEREQTILTLLVNKLGDPDKKVASKIVYLLTEILRIHPGMKSSIVNEIAALLYRSGITDRAQYYGLIYLNQLKFHPDSDTDRLLAKKMIGIYFNIFHQHTTKQSLHKSGESNNSAVVNSKLLGALLTGINRAVPYAKSLGPDDSMALSPNQYNILFTLVHTSTFNTSVQALLLLYQFIVDDTSSALASRFYRALYELLLSPSLLLPSSHLNLFLNLLYKSVKNDQQEKRICAMMKRMLQVCLSSTAPFVCGCLYLLSEIMKHHQCIKVMMIQGELTADEEEEHFTDVVEAEDEDSEAEPQQSGDQNGKLQAQMNDADDVEQKNDTSIKLPSLLTDTNRYNPHKRDPLYSNANNSCLWELTALCSHYHPSVISWSRQLLATVSISYNGDPLSDFTLTAFLDRFVFKNPKKIDTKATHHQAHLTRKPSERQSTAIPVSSAAFLNKNINSIKEDEMFYFTYFTEKARREEVDQQQQEKWLMKKNQKQIIDKDEEAAMDAFADQIMEAELLRAAGGEPDAEDDDQLLEELEADEEDEEDGNLDFEVNVSDEEKDEMEDVIEDENELLLSPTQVSDKEAMDLSDNDDDLDISVFDDEDDDESDIDDEEGQVDVTKKRKLSHLSATSSVAGLGSANVFASADDFADLLAEGAASDQLHPKEAARELSHNNTVDYYHRRSHRQRGKRKGTKK